LHCHVNAGPNRKESISDETLQQVFNFVASSGVRTLDLTGGAPEMHPRFRDIVAQAKKLGVKVIDRCNLTILEVQARTGLAEFLAEHEAEIIASLPCYLEENVDKQRGKGVFEASVAALRRLNALGYGQEHSGLQLNLVFNPQDAVLPPDQQILEQAYKRHLLSEYGIVFNKLYAIANMPIQRFGSMLLTRGRLNDYLALLRANFRPANLSKLMCSNTISIDWQGLVYDCDFNQMLAMPQGGTERRRHISEISPAELLNAPIAPASHCYGCTAGQGSSCGGALDKSST
ncbi:MAG: arsenosugar biosynthesis radical SAM protein ArsS, partial [Methylomonas sp.]|nr:arsenosugar biosynthesis radical SAM protein ArsS [Methylomonas sp.]